MENKEEKKKLKAPAFQMYASDFLTDTQEMTVCEVGAYIRLLLNQWVNTDLPNDTKRLAFIAGMDHSEFTEAWKTISKKFKPTDNGRLMNNRMEDVRANQKKYAIKQSQSGSKGAKIRWGDSEEIGPLPLDKHEIDVSKYAHKSNKVKDIKYLFEGSEFVLAWERWLNYKKKEYNKKYRSEDSENGAIKKLFNLTQGNVNFAIECIDHSISMTWHGIYDTKEIRAKHNGQGNSNQTGNGTGSNYDPNALSAFNRATKENPK